MAHRQILKKEETAVLVTLEASHAGDFFLPPSCPTLFRTELAFSLLEFCLVLAAVVSLWHALEHPAVPNREKKEGCPPYLCSQQGIMLLFSPGFKPCAAGSGGQDGSPLQGAGICPLCVCVCVCVCALVVHACAFHLFCCGKPQITEREDFFPLLADNSRHYGAEITYLSSLSICDSPSFLSLSSVKTFFPPLHCLPSFNPASIGALWTQERGNYWSCNEP